MSMSRAETHRELSGVIITPELIAQRVGRVLRARYGHIRHAAKRLARATRADPRAVQNWMDGVNAPQAAHLVRLMAECDELAAEINRMVKEASCPEA